MCVDYLDGLVEKEASMSGIKYSSGVFVYSDTFTVKFWLNRNKFCLTG